MPANGSRFRDEDLPLDDPSLRLIRPAMQAVAGRDQPRRELVLLLARSAAVHDAQGQRRAIRLTLSACAASNQ